MNWKSHLSNISQTLFVGEDLLDEFKNDHLNWLGFNGVSDSEIQFHENRLETILPLSYKEFLKVSNGFKQLSCFVWDILSIDKIDWLAKFDPTLFELYSTQFRETFNATDEEYFVYGENQETTDFRSEYLVNSLTISGWGDAAILLLNPKVKFGNEWEAWMFATWHLGPIRYRSFEELMIEEYSSYLNLLNRKK
jgi:hypothetical protein